MRRIVNETPNPKTVGSILNPEFSAETLTNEDSGLILGVFDAMGCFVVRTIVVVVSNEAFPALSSLDCLGSPDEYTRVMVESCSEQ